MGTRGNIVFAGNAFYNHNELNFEEIKENPKFLDDCYKIYVHYDMYPSVAIMELQGFLRMKEAKDRAFDPSYLSAWFIQYKCNLLKSFWEKYDYEVTFTGIGLLNELDPWADFTYLIIPKRANAEVSFTIFIYDSRLNLLGNISSEDDISIIEDEEWYY